MNQHPERHTVRRIVLPSGRCIEVVRFNDAPASPPSGLHVCCQCHSELVQPLAWARAGAGRWVLRLECPNCGWTADNTYNRDQVARLEQRLDDGLNEMLRDLQRLTQANMAEEIDRFSAALQTGLILPEDF